MSALHLIVPLQEVLDHGERAWLEDAEIPVTSPIQGRYPSRSELLDLLHDVGLSDQHVHEAPEELTADLADETQALHSTLSVAFSMPSSPGALAERMVYRGHHTPVLVLVHALEVICGGPFVIVVNGETPVLARNVQHHALQD